MKLITSAFSIVTSLAVASSVFAAGAKTYQVTGTILEVTASKIVVQKGTERWELDIGPETKGSAGNFKAGDKVMITYTMSATQIEGPKKEIELPVSKVGAQKKEAPAAVATP